MGERQETTAVKQTVKNGHDRLVGKGRRHENKVEGTVEILKRGRKS